MKQHIIVELPGGTCLESQPEVEEYSCADKQLSIRIGKDVHTYQLESIIGTYIIKYRDDVFCTNLVGKRGKS